MHLISSRPRAVAPFLAVFFLATPLRAAPDAVTHPKPGSPLRRAILDALRKPISATNNKKRVIFTRVEMNVSRSYAYVIAAPVDAKGKYVGVMNLPLQACLRKVGAKWRVLEWSYAGDVISEEWEKKYPLAPKKVWPQNQ